MWFTAILSKSKTLIFQWVYNAIIRNQYILIGFESHVLRQKNLAISTVARFFLFIS
nr:MAG TPA: hypothetical protein [Caudoviricetes sp.]